MTNTIPLEPLASTGSVSTPAQFEAQLTDIAAPLAGEAVLGLRALYLSWRVGSWLDTGLQVKAGDRLTFVLEGGVEVSRALGIRYSAELATWARIGERGPIFRALHDTQSFTVEQDGPLQLKLYPRDRWLDASGRYRGEPPAFNPDEGGGVNVGIIHWRPGTDVAEVLGQAAAGRDAAHW
ncbi:MAG TPA: hypothetical protein DCW78_14690, partial [Pseudomonas sp.]|nr:hypothetical protein [Pseudomonas sp.]